MEELDIEDLFNRGVISGDVYNYIIHKQAEIDELVDGLVEIVNCDCKYTRLVAKELIAKHKG